MLITLTPQRSDDTLTLARAGDALIVNGEAFDFAALADDAVLPRDDVGCAALAGDVTRIGGVLHITLILPLGPKPDYAARYPDPISVTVDGPIDLPVTDAPEAI